MCWNKHMEILAEVQGEKVDFVISSIFVNCPRMSHLYIIPYILSFWQGIYGMSKQHLQEEEDFITEAALWPQARAMYPPWDSWTWVQELWSSWEKQALLLDRTRNEKEFKSSQQILVQVSRRLSGQILRTRDLRSYTGIWRDSSFPYSKCLYLIHFRQQSLQRQWRTSLPSVNELPLWTTAH